MFSRGCSESQVADGHPLFLKESMWQGINKNILFTFYNEPEFEKLGYYNLKSRANEEIRMEETKISNMIGEIIVEKNTHNQFIIIYVMRL